MVHCAGGVSRSPAIVCSYLMRKKGKSFEEIYKYVKKRRNAVDINEGFRKELRTNEVKLMSVKA